jgi:hypothetical protein
MLLLVRISTMQLGHTNVHGSSAHMDAYNAGILHRDFSAGNIVIDIYGKGWLIDWDLSKPVSLESETPRRATRTVGAYVPPHAVIS